MEAASVNLSKSRYVKIRYRSNVNVILQSRQTGVHGGIQDHILLPASSPFTTQTISFSSFKGSLKPLDLSDAAKFNFALLENNPSDSYADFNGTSI
jgi:hypothetical protein